MVSQISSCFSCNSGKKKKKDKVLLRQLFRVASVAAGIQFGWALQLSLLTPYVQELGIPHTFASYIWLCGPITGMVVQPIVGYYSDNCKSRFGRRRPFVVAGAIIVVVAVLIIGFSADLGHWFGDPISGSTKKRAIALFVLGFWLLDLANNTLQGPCRALLADFTGTSQRRTRRANAFFSLFMAVGNILGFATGAYSNWSKIFPFALTIACDTACANLKSAFFLDIILLAGTTLLSITAARETPFSELKEGDGAAVASKEGGGSSHGSHKFESSRNLTRSVSNDKYENLTSPQQRLDMDLGRQLCESKVVLNNENEIMGKWCGYDEEAANEIINSPNESPEARSTATGADNSHAAAGSASIEKESESSKAFFLELYGTMKTMPTQMWYILLVTALTWVSWFPFLLFDTDWMGSDVYRGVPDSNIKSETDLYNKGVRMGSFGLMLNAVVLGLMSLTVEPICRRIGSSILWSIANVIMALCFAATFVITKIAQKGPSPPSDEMLGVILLVFAALGVPLAVTYSVPYALTASFTSSIGGGQGLSMGVLNLAVVIPQVLISVGSGPWDQVFGGGNMPSFLLASVAAMVGGVFALLKLPKLQPKPNEPYEPPQVELPNIGIRRTRSAPVFHKLL